MGLPGISNIWTISANNRIPYVSLLDTTSKYLFQLKEFLKTNGYTVKGSSNGTTASPANVLITDGVDRWVTAANVVTRGTVSGAAQSWIVLRDGSGVDILLTYQGTGVSPTGDDFARISFSRGNLFTAQATATFQPTATDETVIVSNTSVIGSAASADRVWFGWVDSTKKCCRFAIARSGSFTGIAWGVEKVQSIVRPPAVWSPSTWGFQWTPAGSAIVQSGTLIGAARTTVASVAQNIAISIGVEYLSTSVSQFGAEKPVLQGASGYPMFPLAISSVTANSRGKLGNLVDWWLGRTGGGSDGDMYGPMRFIGMGGFVGGSNGSGAWPWDGITVPILT